MVRLLLYCFDISNLYSLRCDNLAVSSIDEGSSLLSKEVRDSEVRLTASCDNLGVSSLGGSSSLLPEEMRDSEARLTASMHLYSQRCDNLRVSYISVTPLYSWRR